MTRPISAAFARDLASSYAASVARVASWLVVSAVVYRRGGAEDLALLMLLRGTVGLLSYAGLGIAPALVPMLARPLRVLPPSAPRAQIEYAAPTPADDRLPDHARRTFTTAVVLVAFGLATGLLIAFACAAVIPYAIDIEPRKSALGFAVAGWLALATALRVMGDVFGARLQAAGRVAVDNVCVVAGEAAFVAMACWPWAAKSPASDAALAFAAGAAVASASRASLAVVGTGFGPASFDAKLVRPLVYASTFVLLAQGADWLYAPLNQILIGTFLSLRDVANYVPALQVDAALLLAVAGLTNVLLPVAARAAARRDRRVLRDCFVQGSIASVAVLTVLSSVVWAFDTELFLAWFGQDLAATSYLLPFVLIHTTVGSVGGVGRSVLLGMGLAKPYAVAALVGGAANAGLAGVFLALTNLGVHGVVLATIISVSVRCLVWTPWYTLRAIDRLSDPSLPR